MDGLLIATGQRHSKFSIPWNVYIRSCVCSRKLFKHVGHFSYIHNLIRVQLLESYFYICFSTWWVLIYLITEVINLLQDTNLILKNIRSLVIFYQVEINIYLLLVNCCGNSTHLIVVFLKSVRVVEMFLLRAWRDR